MQGRACSGSLFAQVQPVFLSSSKAAGCLQVCFKLLEIKRPSRLTDSETELSCQRRLEMGLLQQDLHWVVLLNSPSVCCRDTLCELSSWSRCMLSCPSCPCSCQTSLFTLTVCETGEPPQLALSFQSITFLNFACKASKICLSTCLHVFALHATSCPPTGCSARTAFSPRHALHQACSLSEDDRSAEQALNACLQL